MPAKYKAGGAPKIVALACAGVVIAPWLLRDAAEFGRFVPVTTSGGIALGGDGGRLHHQLVGLLRAGRP